MPLGQPVDDELDLSIAFPIATEKYTSWANANLVNHHVAFSSNKPEPSIDFIYSNSGIVDERTIASSSNPMVMNSHQLLMQQMAKLNQQQVAIQQMQQRMQLQKHQELRHYVTNNSSFASFDVTKTDTFQVPTKMYQDEVSEERGRPKKRATVGSLSPSSNMFDAYPFVMNQAFASSDNVANSTSLASITRAQSMGSFKNSDQCPFPRMNLTSSTVASTAKTANFTPSSVDSIRAWYHPQPQKLRGGGEERSPCVPEQQPLQNNVDCCDSDGEDSIDALFKDFTYTSPLNDSFQRIMKGLLCTNARDDNKPLPLATYGKNNDWMCSVEDDSEQQSTTRHVGEKNDGLNNDTKSKANAVLQAFIKRSFERHNMEYEPIASSKRRAFMKRSFERHIIKPTIASTNGSAEGAHHYWNNDCASLIPCSRNDAAGQKNEEDMDAHSVVCHEEDSRRVSHEAQDKPIETSWLCRPCKNID
jgi:hypothetical protein